MYTSCICSLNDLSIDDAVQHYVDDEEETGGSGGDESESGSSSIGGRLIEELQEEEEQEEDRPDTSSLDYSSAECVLRLLLEIIDCKLPGVEESLLVSLLPDLQRLALSRSEEDDPIVSLANDVMMKILLRSAPHLSSRPETTSGGDSFRDLLLELRTADYLLADSPSLRAFGVSMLARSIKQSRQVCYLADDRLICAKSSEFTRSDALYRITSLCSH